MSDADLASIVIEELLHNAIERGASDLYLSPGSIPFQRINLKRSPIQGEDPISAEALQEALKLMAPPESWADFNERGRAAFTIQRGELGRFRASLLQTMNGPSAIFHRVPLRPPTTEELKVPESLLDHIWPRGQGLILVGSPPGHGRSQLLAALIDVLNRYRNRRILTLEDPVEIIHKNLNCLVTQRTIRYYGGSYQNALKALGHERAEIIVIAELLEAPALEAALELARAGSLVLASVPFRTASEAFHSLIAMAPKARRAKLRAQLATQLLATLTQVLIPQTGGRSVLAVREQLLNDRFIAQLISKGEFNQLPLMLQGSTRPGLIELNQALIKAVQANDISSAQAFRSSAQPIRFAQSLRRAGIELSGLNPQEQACLDLAEAPQAKPTRDSSPSNRTTGSMKRRGWV